MQHTATARVLMKESRGAVQALKRFAGDVTLKSTRRWEGYECRPRPAVLRKVRAKSGNVPGQTADDKRAPQGREGCYLYFL